MKKGCSVLRSLLDINVIIALLDSDHAFHDRSHHWWEERRSEGWASCPITENGVVRVMSNPNYSATAQLSPGDLISRLRTFVKETDHQFWPDDLSVRDDTAILAARIHGSRQVTDLYLLALAAKNGARLATFDRSIPLSAAPNASTTNLLVI
jgi:toxin-antitoxin system PIN domain toxin